MTKNPKEETNAVEEEVKEKKELKKSDKGIMLITFKDIANVDNITYAGFKTHINAEDGDKYKQSDLEKELDEFKNKSAFKI
ncbi:hypothetical protein [Methanobacterium sp.]|uniref:hypothetical protein n=1 Tax=Methanobacterium sp. TaxID=2164 RepID=UPI003C72DAC7